MKTIHVVLVSDQTVPNILAIHQHMPDELLFITTLEMEKKKKVEATLACLNALALTWEDGKTHRVVVQEDSLLDAHRKLDEWIIGREEAEFTINLTGGTKIMSIGVYEFFKDYGATMRYIPLHRNEFITPFPKRLGNSSIALPLRLGVKEYLLAYGLKIINEKTVRTGAREAANRRDLSAWIVEQYASLKPLLERLSDKLRKQRDNRDGLDWGTSYTPVNEQEKEFFDRLGFVHTGTEYRKHLTKSEIMYLTGGWLEEYCFNALAAMKGQGIDDVVTGVKIMNALKRDNEFDVMFTRDNALFTVECKSLDQNDDPKADALYKIAALQKDFGLRVQSFFVSTSPHILRDGQLKSAIAARAEQFNTTVIPPDEVVCFAEKLKKVLKF